MNNENIKSFPFIKTHKQHKQTSHTRILKLPPTQFKIYNTIVSYNIGNIVVSRLQNNWKCDFSNTLFCHSFQDVDTALEYRLKCIDMLNGLNLNYQLLPPLFLRSSHDVMFALLPNLIMISFISGPIIPIITDLDLDAKKVIFVLYQLQYKDYINHKNIFNVINYNIDNDIAVL